LPKLSTVDIKNNQIESPEGFAEFWPKIEDLQCLYVRGNGATRMINQFRRTLLSTCPKLAHLDERPVTELDRLLVEAFMRGGKEEEEKARKEYHEAKNRAIRESCKRNSKIEERAKKDRKEIFK